MTDPKAAQESLPPGLEVVRYSPADRERFLAFRRYHYGETSPLSTGAYVDWLFPADKPAAEGGSPMFVCRSAEAVVGAQGFIRIKLKVAGETIRSAWLVDFAVREEARKHGVGTALALHTRKETDVRLLLEGTPAAVRIAERFGWKAMGQLPLWVRPLSADYGRQRKAGLSGTLLFAASAPVLRLIEWRAVKAAARDGVELVAADRFDARADQIWEACAPELPVACRRDLAFLEWRFGRYPDASRYRIHWLQRKGETVGYAVLRSGEHHGAKAGLLIDFLCPAALQPALLARVLELFRREGAAVVCCLHLGPRDAANFKPLGFFQRSSGWPFMVRCLTEQAGIAAQVEDRSRWYLTGADSNVDRPKPGAEGQGTATTGAEKNG